MNTHSICFHGEITIFVELLAAWYLSKLADMTNSVGSDQMI